MRDVVAAWDRVRFGDGTAVSRDFEELPENSPIEFPALAANTRVPSRIRTSAGAKDPMVYRQPTRASVGYFGAVHCRPLIRYRKFCSIQTDRV
jgi:hypothetical protein